MLVEVADCPKFVVLIGVLSEQFTAQTCQIAHQQFYQFHPKTVAHHPNNSLSPLLSWTISNPPNLPLSLSILRQILLLPSIIKKMNFHYCSHNPSANHPYHLSGVRERNIPTFTHSQIFNYDSYNNPRVRCTPTFHSTALDVDGYQVLTNQNIRRQNYKETCSAVNGCKVGCRHSRKEEGTVYGGTLWYDSAKQELFKSLACCPGNYSRDRKQADLSSNPVFGGCVMQPYCDKVEPEPEPKLQPQPQPQRPQPTVENHHKPAPAPIQQQKFVWEGIKGCLQQKQTGEWAMWEKQARQKWQRERANKLTFGKPGVQTNNKMTQSAVQTGETKEVRPKSAALDKKKAGKRLEKKVVVGKPSFAIVRNRQ